MLREHSVVSDSATPWTVAHQAPLSMGFSRQEYWSGWPFPPPGHLSDPGIEPVSPALQADSLPTEPPGKPSSPYFINMFKNLFSWGGPCPWVEIGPSFGGNISPSEWARGFRREGQGSWGWGCGVVSHPASHIRSVRSRPHSLPIQVLGLDPPNLVFEMPLR